MIIASMFIVAVVAVTSVHVTSRCHCKTFETTYRIIARHLSSGPTASRGCHFAVRRANEDQVGKKERGEGEENDTTDRIDVSKYNVFKYIHGSDQQFRNGYRNLIPFNLIHVRIIVVDVAKI